MTEERALEIIAAWGADSTRWPDDERAGVLALAARPAVAAALAEALPLDALLGDWARADVAAAPFDAARLVPAPAVVGRRAHPLRRWLAAGAMAAAVAAAVVLTPIGQMPPVSLAQPATAVATIKLSTVPSATASGDDSSDAEFAYVFTPTVDEDTLI